MTEPDLPIVQAPRVPLDPKWIPSEPPPMPATILGSFEELLRCPENLVNRARAAERRREAGRLAAGAALALVAYGLAAGFFQGGSQILVAGIKTPIIVLGSVLLCAPSLYVFAALAGADLSLGRFWTGIGGFLGLTSLLMLGLLPVNWLFSVSSQSMWFIMLLHLAIWQTSLVFAYRFLRKTLFPQQSAKVLVLWTMLFLCVSYQVTTSLRPVLWRPAGTAVVDFRKKTFLDNWAESVSLATPVEDLTR